MLKPAVHVQQQAARPVPKQAAQQQAAQLMPETTAQPKSAPEALSDSGTDSDPEWTAACEIQAQLQEMLAHFAAQHCTLSQKVADLDAQQAACDTPSAMLATQRVEACITPKISGSENDILALHPRRI